VHLTSAPLWTSGDIAAASLAARRKIDRLGCNTWVKMSGAYACLYSSRCCTISPLQSAKATANACFRSYSTAAMKLAYFFRDRSLARSSCAWSDYLASITPMTVIQCVVRLTCFWILALFKDANPSLPARGLTSTVKSGVSVHWPHSSQNARSKANTHNICIVHFRDICAADPMTRGFDCCAAQACVCTLTSTRMCAACGFTLPTHRKYRTPVQCQQCYVAC
jgi:hypothetical protein